MKIHDAIDRFLDGSHKFTVAVLPKVEHVLFYRKGTRNGRPARKHRFTGKIEILMTGSHYPIPLWIPVDIDEKFPYIPKE